MRSFRRTVALALVASPFALLGARAAETAPPDRSEVRPVMHKFLGNMLALQPYMVSSSAFNDPKNSREIGSRLDALAKETKGLEHFSSLKTPGFAVSAEALQDQVKQTQRAFHVGRKEYARWLLTETVEGCISCHSQLPTAKGLVIDTAQVKGTPLERADFLFATRQFDEAVKLYNQIIADYRAPAKANEIDAAAPAENALKHKLAIYLRVRRDPEGAAKGLEADLANKNLPPILQETMQQWIVELRKPGIVPAFQPATATREQLEGYAKQVLAEDLHGVNLFTSPAKTASYLVLSGILFEALATPHGDLSPSEILLWLAKCDRALNRDFFFSLSDLYLQECIRRAPHTPIAKQCYQDFAESVTLAFTGSRGTELPSDMNALLARLKKLSQ